MKIWKKWGHIVRIKPYPLGIRVAVWGVMLGLIIYIKYQLNFLLMLGLLNLILAMKSWFRNVEIERNGGEHKRSVNNGLRIGVILFITSEICFFGSFFWSLFHICWAPSEVIGCLWPPFGVANAIEIDPFRIPLLNTIILVSSGGTLTLAHGYIKEYKISRNWLLITLGLGIIFIICQWYEYRIRITRMKSVYYGSIFFLLTGFHGFHVLLGILWLSYKLWRIENIYISVYRHTGYEGAIWYWHFVDVVWLFLYIFLYYYGYNDLN